MGSDGFNRILLFQPCRGTPCTPETHDFKGFWPDFNRIPWNLVKIWLKTVRPPPRPTPFARCRIFGGGKRVPPAKYFWRPQKVGFVWSVPVPSKGKWQGVSKGGPWRLRGQSRSRRRGWESRPRSRLCFARACFYWGFMLLCPLSSKLSWIFSSNLPGNLHWKMAEIFG